MYTISYAVNGNSEGIVIENCTLEAESATGGAGLYVAGDVSITGAEVLGSSGSISVNRDTFGIYAVTLKITNSNVVGIAEDNTVSNTNGIHLNGSAAKLIFESGNIIAKTSGVSDDSYAVYTYTGDLALPAKYWMRSSKSGDFAEGTWDGANVGPYFELTTTKPSGSITNISEMDKVYNGLVVSDPTVNALSTGAKTFKYKIKGADDSTYTTEAPKNAGVYTCLITVAADENYTEATTTKDFVISKATLTVTANDHQITYGEAPANDGVTYSGLVNNENENVLGGMLDYDYSYIQFDDVGNAYTITPKGYESDNYELTYKPGTLTVVAADQSAPTSPVGVDTSYIDTNDGKITGVTSKMEYRKDGDANCTAVAGTEITNLAAGKYYVRYTANVNYNASPDMVITISLGGKRTPTVDTDPTASRVIVGGKLSDSILTGGVASVPGTFAWKDGTEVLDSKGTVQKTVVFTPNDTATYNTVEFDVDVTVVVCDTVSGEHEYTVPQKDSADHWNKCSGCDAIDMKIKHSGTDDGDCTTEEKCACGHVIAEARTAHSDGTATCTEKAKCEVCNTEYGELLDHNYEWVIDKEPTANEEGSKHEECTVCKAKRNENTAIPKTETNSPQTGDNSNMALWIALLFISSMGFVATTALSRKKRTI